MELKQTENIEIRLLTALLKMNNDEEIGGLLESEPIDWDDVIRVAEAHRVMPLLFQKIKTKFAAKIPADIVNQFQSRSREIAGLNFGRTTQLIKLVKLLQNQGVSVIAYKGMTLAAIAYGDIGWRQFTDIDLLIRRHEFPQVKRIFEQNNCLPAWKLSEKQENAALKYYYEYPFFYGANKTLIEVHWKFTEPFFAFDIDMDEIFARAVTVGLCGKPVPTMAAEDLLLILAAHGAKHFWKRLSWICDIAGLVENTVIDWNAALVQAKRVGGLRMLNLALFLAADLLNAGLPAEITEKIAADRQIKELAGIIKRNLFVETGDFSSWRKMAKMHLKMRERNLDKLKYSQRLLQTKVIDSLFLPMGRPQ